MGRGYIDERRFYRWEEVLSMGGDYIDGTQSAQGEGSLLTAGNYFESGKSECNNSGYKLTGLTWWP